MSLLSSIIPSLAQPLSRSASSAPQTSPEDVGVRPAYEVRDGADAFALTVHLPGVAREGLEVTADHAEVRVVGHRAWKQPEGWTLTHRETSEAPFVLVLDHDAAVDVDRIHAELKDGILRVSLPKAEALKPRKVTVQ